MTPLEALGLAYLFLGLIVGLSSRLSNSPTSTPMAVLIGVLWLPLLLIAVILQARQRRPS